MVDMTAAAERLMVNRTVDANGCWLWTGHVEKTTGYGRFSFQGRACSVHRLAYETWVGPIPAGLHIDHLCRVRTCMNPAHLEAVTQAENNRRAREAYYVGKFYACGHPQTAGGPCPTCREAKLVERAARRLARKPATPKPSRSGVRKCGHPYVAPGDCAPCNRARVTRYAERVKAGEVEPPTVICSECSRTDRHWAKGMCRRCYTRLYKRATYVPASHRASAQRHSSTG